MGQRLCLSIISGGKEIANAYYHWSAYTMSTIEIINHFIDFATDENATMGLDDNDIAILGLQATGATFPRRELINAREECNWFDPLKTDRDSNYMYKEGNSRNDGIIGITRAERQSTRDNGEGFATINLDDRTVDFEVYSWYNNIDELNEFLDKKVKAEDIPEIGYNLNAISFTDFRYFSECLDNLEDYYWTDGTEIYGMIA